MIRRNDFTDFSTFFEVARKTEALHKEMDNAEREVTVVPTEKRYYQQSTSPSKERKDRSPTTRKEYHLSSATLTQKPKFTSYARLENASDNKTVICVRCGETVHYRSIYRNPSKLFCSRCKKEGVMSQDCQCDKKNITTKPDATPVLTEIAS